MTGGGGDKIPRSPPRAAPAIVARHSPSKSMPYNNNSEENLQGLLAMGGGTAPTYNNNPRNENIMVRGEMNHEPGSPANFDRDVSPGSPRVADPSKSPHGQVKD